MATLIAQRSTYWVISGGSNPYEDGDYRYFWSIYYEQTSTDKINNRSKLIIDYYIQTHKSTSIYADVIPYPSGTSTVKIDGSTFGSITTASGSIVVGNSWALKYIGRKTDYIPHKQDGSKSFTFQGSGFGKGTATSTYTLPSIPRNSTLGTIPTFNIDDGLSVPVTRYVSSYYDKLEILYGSTVLKTVTSTGNATTIDITFTEDELDNIYRLIPTGSSAKFTFKITTYSNSTLTTQIGTSSSKTATGNFTIVLPTFEDFDYVDILTNTVDLTGSNKTIVKDVSNVYITISLEQLAIANTRQATISHYVINGDIVSSTGKKISHDLGEVSSNKVTIQAVDSRGNASPVVSKTFENFIKYKSPVITVDTINVERNENGVGRIIDISIDGTWWSGNFGLTNNELTFEYYYRKAEDTELIQGDISEITIDTTIENKFYISGSLISDADDKGFDVDSSYYIELDVIDTLLRGQYVKGTVSPGEPAIAIYKNKIAINGKYDEDLGGTQIWNELYLNGMGLNTIGSILVTSENKDPSSDLTGTWELVNKEFRIWMTTFASENAEDYFTPTDNVSSVSLGLTRNGNMLHLRLYVTLSTTVDDTNLELGTFNLEKLGISRFSLTRYGMVAGSDSGDCFVVYQVTYQGVVTILDVITKDGSNTLASGKTFYFDIMSVLYPTHMLDSSCDKFYWKRTK